jgi:hypothetical protein
MKETTHREYLVWVAHFEDEWNQHTKQDWYLAQIAREVSCVLEDSKGRKEKTIKSFLIKFGFGKSQIKSQDSKSIWEHSKQIWMQSVSRKGLSNGQRNRNIGGPASRRPQRP